MLMEIRVKPADQSRLRPRAMDMIMDMATTSTMGMIMDMATTSTMGMARIMAIIMVTTMER